MARNKKPPRSLADLTRDVVRAYCAGHALPPPDLLDLITSVGDALHRAASQEADAAAVPARLSRRQIRHVDRDLRAALSGRTVAARAANDNHVATDDERDDPADGAGCVVRFFALSPAMATGLPPGEEQAS